MVYHERANLHINYFIPWHRNYSGQHNQCKIHMVHDKKVKCNALKYTMAYVYMYSDWPYFLWQGKNKVFNCFKIKFLSRKINVSKVT